MRLLLLTIRKLLLYLGNSLYQIILSLALLGVTLIWFMELHLPSNPTLKESIVGDFEAFTATLWIGPVRHGCGPCSLFGLGEDLNALAGNRQ